VSKTCCSIVYAIEKATTFKLHNYLNTILGMLDLSYKQLFKFTAQTGKFKSRNPKWIKQKNFFNVVFFIDDVSREHIIFLFVKK
jgi:hypothetical protein